MTYPAYQSSSTAETDADAIWEWFESLPQDQRVTLFDAATEVRAEVMARNPKAMMSVKGAMEVVAKTVLFLEDAKNGKRIVH